MGDPKEGREQLMAGFIVAVPAGSADLPLLRAAIEQAGGIVREAWERLAESVLTRGTGAYVQGLQGPDSTRYPLDGDPLAVGVFNMAPHAGAVEDGFGPFNLADRVDWSRPSVKHGKNGPYLIIPFRHFSPGARTASSRKRSMPAGVYDVARQLKQGERIQLKQPATPGVALHRGDRVVASRHGRAVVPTSTGAFTKPRRVWIQGQPHTQHVGGERSPAAAAAAKGLGLPAGRVSPSIFDGLQRSSTGYATFRVLTPKSSWVIPGRPGLGLAARAASVAEPEIRRMLADALARDVAAAVEGALSGA